MVVHDNEHVCVSECIDDILSHNQAFRKALEDYVLTGQEISEDGPSFPVKFLEKHIKLDIPSSTCELKDGWTLKCLSDPEVSRRINVCTWMHA